MPLAVRAHNHFRVDSPDDLRILRTIHFISPTIDPDGPEKFGRGRVALDL